MNITLTDSGTTVQFALHPDGSPCRQATSTRDCEQSHQWHKHTRPCFARALGVAFENWTGAWTEAYDDHDEATHGRLERQSVVDQAAKGLCHGTISCFCGRKAGSTTVAKGLAILATLGVLA